jgi:hypothetical protein
LAGLIIPPKIAVSYSDEIGKEKLMNLRGCRGDISRIIIDGKEPKSLYCKKCGVKLDNYLIQDSLNKFDEDTGKPIYVLGWKCPNNKIFSTGHTRVIQNHSSLITVNDKGEYIKYDGDIYESSYGDEEDEF